MTSRKPYIVNYFHNNIVKKLNTMEVNVVYVSKRFKYAVVYIDSDKGDNYLKNQLKKTKGLINVTPSLIFDETLNIERTVKVLDSE